MPNSNCSGFSTASKQAVAQISAELMAFKQQAAASMASKDAEMEAEKKKRDAEFEAMNLCVWK